MQISISIESTKETLLYKRTVLSIYKERKKVIKKEKCVTKCNMSSLLDGISVGSLTPKRKSKVSFGSLESSYLGSNLFVGQKRIETEETNPNLFQVDKTPISKNLTKKVTQKFSM